MIKSVTVYLGSSEGNSPIFMQTAFELGEILASTKIDVIYGGSVLGTMNALANGALSKGGKVTGIMPKNFRGGEIAKSGIDFITVNDMSERKKLLEELSDAVIVLPGSFGTMDELFQYAVHKQLGYINKNIYILNLNGYYNYLKMQFDTMYNCGFIKFNHNEFFNYCNTLDELIISLKKNG